MMVRSMPFNRIVHLPGEIDKMGKLSVTPAASASLTARAMPSNNFERVIAPPRLGSETSFATVLSSLMTLRVGYSAAFAAPFFLAAAAALALVGGVMERICVALRFKPGGSW